MYERDIFEDDVRLVIEDGEIIENYEHELPYPTRLVFKIIALRPIHVVAAYNNQDNEVIIITTYEPDGHLWQNDFKKRRF